MGARSARSHQEIGYGLATFGGHNSGNGSCGRLSSRDAVLRGLIRLRGIGELGGSVRNNIDRRHRGNRRHRSRRHGLDLVSGIDKTLFHGNERCLSALGSKLFRQVDKGSSSASSGSPESNVVLARSPRKVVSAAPAASKSFDAGADSFASGCAAIGRSLGNTLCCSSITPGGLVSVNMFALDKHLRTLGSTAHE